MTRPARHESAPEAAGRPPEADALPEGVITLTQALTELAAILPGLRHALESRQAARIEPLAYRLDELADALGVSRRAIERERAAGRFPRPDLTIGKMPLWRPETVRGWIERGGAAVMPTARDCWVLARLMADQPVAAAELAAMSDAFRPLAEAMAAAPGPDRGRILDDFLTGRTDRDTILRAVADTDPMKPPPAVGSAPPSNDWPPLSLEELPPADPFPVDVLPEPAARLVREGADAIGCPRDFLGVPTIAVAGGTVGRSASLMLKSGYFASATAFMGCVGPPSDGKTPGLKAVADAVRAIDDELAAEHAQAVELWKLDAAGLPKGTKPPPAPKPRRIDIDDATMEVLPLILADNPRGLIMIRDELSAFILGMNQFKAGGKGSDRANALKIWSGDRIVKDRVNHEGNAPVRCPHPSLTIVGGLTPDMLGELLDPRGRADGFLDRFLLCYPDPLPVPGWTDRGIPEGVAVAWRSLIAKLWMRPMDAKDGRPIPHVVRFTPEGEARWLERYNAHAAEMNAPDFPPHLRGPWGKLREYAGRLTLILTLMHHAAWCLADPDADLLAIPNAGPDRVDGAWRLIAYFKAHARRIQAAIASGPVDGPARAVKVIVEWIRAGHRASFTESEISQARRWIKGDDLTDALSFLTGRGAIRERPTPQPGPKGGRPPSPAYDVNPALLTSPKTSVIYRWPGSAAREKLENPRRSWKNAG